MSNVLKPLYSFSCTTVRSCIRNFTKSKSTKIPKVKVTPLNTSLFKFTLRSGSILCLYMSLLQRNCQCTGSVSSLQLQVSLYDIPELSSLDPPSLSKLHPFIPAPIHVGPFSFSSRTHTKWEGCKRRRVEAHTVAFPRSVQQRHEYGGI